MYLLAECYSECRYAVCLHAECHLAECCHSTCMLNVMLSAIVLYVVMLNVAAPIKRRNEIDVAQKSQKFNLKFPFFFLSKIFFLSMVLS